MCIDICGRQRRKKKISQGDKVIRNIALKMDFIKHDQINLENNAIPQHAAHSTPWHDAGDTTYI
jgi:hypothetical protein